MKVWFNHWFSTAYYFIDSLKKDGFYVIASNKRESCVYKTNADEFYVEPDLENEEYLAYCLDFCKSHDIDIFVPRKGMSCIIQHLAEFDALNVKVLCESNKEIFDIFNSKVKTASYFKDLNIVSVPESILVNSVDEFISAYNSIRAHWCEVCIKYDSDEGGQSYKRISPHEPNIGRISENNGLVYSLGYVVSCLESVKQFKPIVVMPYLNGVEVSVDCFGVDNKFIAVPRQKLSNRVTHFEQDSRLYAICRELYRVSGLTAPFNVQFRYHNNKLYILEVNTRLSGGSWKAKYVGVDFISLATHSLIGDNIEIPEMHFQPRDLSNLEGVVELC